MRSNALVNIAELHGWRMQASESQQSLARTRAFRSGAFRRRAASHCCRKGVDFANESAAFHADCRNRLVHRKRSEASRSGLRGGNIPEHVRRIAAKGTVRTKRCRLAGPPHFRRARAQRASLACNDLTVSSFKAFIKV